MCLFELRLSLWLCSEYWSVQKWQSFFYLRRVQKEHDNVIWSIHLVPQLVVLLKNTISATLKTNTIHYFILLNNLQLNKKCGLSLDYNLIPIWCSLIYGQIVKKGNVIFYSAILLRRNTIDLWSSHNSEPSFYY